MQVAATAQSVLSAMYLCVGFTIIDVIILDDAATGH